jgi:hypothetical protein
VSWRASVKAEDEYIIWFGQDGDGYRAGSVVVAGSSFFPSGFCFRKISWARDPNSAQEGNEEEL